MGSSESEDKKVHEVIARQLAEAKKELREELSQSLREAANAKETDALADAADALDAPRKAKLLQKPEDLVAGIEAKVRERTRALKGPGNPMVGADPGAQDQARAKAKRELKAAYDILVAVRGSKSSRNADDQG